MCKISICIPAYNSIEKLNRLIESIKIQKYEDYEVIITDDSTNDEVKEYIEALKGEIAPKITYIKNKERLGATPNCNLALSKASGEYIKVMHHDDWFTDENSLELFAKMLDDSPNADFAFSGTYQVSANDKFKRSISEETVKRMNEDYRYVYISNEVGAPSAVIFRNKNYRFDEKVNWLLDADIYLTIFKNNSDFVHTCEPLISIGIAEDQLTNSCNNNWKLQKFEYGYVLRKHKLYMNVKCVVKYLTIVKCYLYSILETFFTAKK